MNPRTLTDAVTGQPSTQALTLTALSRYPFADGTASVTADVWESDPFDVSMQAEDRAATVPLTPTQDESIQAILPGGSASTSVQTTSGQTHIETKGQHSGDGGYSATASLTQGTKGLFFDPGYGLLLPAHTTLTVSANAFGALQIDGHCPPDLGLERSWCEYVSASAYLELRHISLEDQQSSVIDGDLFQLNQFTESIGQAGQQTGSRQLLVSVTNPTDQAMPIGFRYNVGLNGRSVISAVPEPSSWVLLSLGLLAIVTAKTRARLKQT